MNPRKNIKAKQRRRARMKRRLKWWDGERRFTILNHGPSIPPPTTTNHLEPMTRTEPYKHLRMHPENHCQQWQNGDKVLIIGKTYTDGELGLDYQPCPLCWPKKRVRPEP